MGRRAAPLFVPRAAPVDRGGWSTTIVLFFPRLDPQLLHAAEGFAEALLDLFGIVAVLILLLICLG